MLPSQPVAPVLPGETLAGKYRVERVLGRGGMGIVVAARHLQLDERVAIKFLLGERSESSADRFLREGRAAAKVKGEHVCRVFDFGRLETGEPYLVMEHLEGTDLARKLEREGPQAPSSVVGWVIQACDALADAHAIGIVHRDLKPANLFLADRADGSACAKVLDFGISKVARAETITAPATTMGSPVYMSPEQMESARDVDARSDVWSLGVLMYELLAGKLPFVGDSMVQLSVLVRERREEPLERVAPGVPEGLARVITRCLEKKADARFASVADLAAALAPYAPPDVSALVARLVKRSKTEPAMPLALTSPDLERATPLPALFVTETSDAIHPNLARETLAPIQTTMVARVPSASVRRWPAAAAVAATLALGVGSFATSSFNASASPPTLAATTPVPALTENAPLVAASAVKVTATTTNAPPSLLPLTVPAAVAKAPAPPPATPAATSASPGRKASAIAVTASSSPVVSAASSAASTAAGPRRRELDRDDP